MKTFTGDALWLYIYVHICTHMRRREILLMYHLSAFICRSKIVSLFDGLIRRKLKLHKLVFNLCRLVMFILYVRRMVKMNQSF